MRLWLRPFFKKKAPGAGVLLNKSTSDQELFIAISYSTLFRAAGFFGVEGGGGGGETARCVKKRRRRRLIRPKQILTDHIHVDVREIRLRIHPPRTCVYEL